MGRCQATKRKEDDPLMHFYWSTTKGTKAPAIFSFSHVQEIIFKLITCSSLSLVIEHFVLLDSIVVISFIQAYLISLN